VQPLPGLVNVDAQTICPLGARTRRPLVPSFALIRLFAICESFVCRPY